MAPRSRLSVADTNTIVSGLTSPSGVPAQILQFMEADRFQPVVSYPLFDEYATVLARRKVLVRLPLGSSQAIALLKLMLQRATMVQEIRRSGIPVRDHVDEMILDTAITGHADYLVTGDEDMLVLAGRFSKRDPVQRDRCLGDSISNWRWRKFQSNQRFLVPNGYIALNRKPVCVRGES